MTPPLLVHADPYPKAGTFLDAQRKVGTPEGVPTLQRSIAN
jgi:hypothetical protein